MPGHKLLLLWQSTKSPSQWIPFPGHGDYSWDGIKQVRSGGTEDPLSCWVQLSCIHRKLEKGAEGTGKKYFCSILYVLDHTISVAFRFAQRHSENFITQKVLMLFLNLVWTGHGGTDTSDPTTRDAEAEELYEVSGQPMLQRKAVSWNKQK